MLPRRCLVPAAVALCTLVAIVGCGGSEAPVALPAPTPEPTATPLPTSTPAPTATPEPTVAPAPTATPTPSTPQRIRYGDDPAQIGWLQIPVAAAGAPTQDLPIVVLIHGGFWAEPWDYTLMSDLANGFEDAGIATWNIEFRRLRGRGGWPATFDDVRAAIDHLRVLAQEHPLDLNHVTVVGHSSGGHLALWSARDDVVTDPPVQVAIGLAAITDLRLTTASIGLLGGTPSEVPERWLAAAPSLDPDRVVIIHGENDSVVPVFAVDNAVEAGVRLEVVPGADHLSLITQGTVGFDLVIETVLELLVAR